MSFSEKMRDSLGAEGLRLEVSSPEEPIGLGTTLHATVNMVGGTKPALVDALVLRLVEADRHWLADDGGHVSEQDALALEDRRHLTAGWRRHTLLEERVELAREVEVGVHETVEVQISVPSECGLSGVSRAHTLNVQADIRGQIDPTGNARVVLAHDNG